MKHLRELRLQHQLSQKELAEMIHRDQRTISKYENDEAAPDIPTLKLLADILHTSIDYLLDYYPAYVTEETLPYGLDEDKYSDVIAFLRNLDSNILDALAHLVQTIESKNNPKDK